MRLIADSRDVVVLFFTKNRGCDQLEFILVFIAKKLKVKSLVYLYLMYVITRKRMGYMLKQHLTNVLTGQNFNVLEVVIYASL